MARRLLTDPNESLRDALKELLFSNDQFRWGRLENLLREVTRLPSLFVSLPLLCALVVMGSTKGSTLVVPQEVVCVTSRR
jgi:hypothetical protein